MGGPEANGGQIGGEEVGEEVGEGVWGEGFGGDGVEI